MFIVLTDWFLHTDEEPYEPGYLYQNQMEDPQVYWKYQEDLEALNQEENDSSDKLLDLPPV